MPFRYLYNPYHQRRTTTPQLLPPTPRKKTPHISTGSQPPPPTKRTKRTGDSRWPSAFAISDGHANLCGLPRLAISPRALRDTSTGRALVGLEGEDTVLILRKFGGNQLRLVVYPIIYEVLYIPGGCLIGISSINRYDNVTSLPKKPTGWCFRHEDPFTTLKESWYVYELVFSVSDSSIGYWQSMRIHVSHMFNIHQNNTPGVPRYFRFHISKPEP